MNRMRFVVGWCFVILEPRGGRFTHWPTNWEFDLSVERNSKGIHNVFAFGIVLVPDFACSVVDLQSFGIGKPQETARSKVRDGERWLK